MVDSKLLFLGHQHQEVPTNIKEASLGISEEKSG
jgi:hypothetical protein